MQAHLHMDNVAEKNGFLVAYLNGTSASERLPGKMLTWNAGGGCCGLSARSNIDDISYITSVVQHLTQEYGIDPKRVYGTGHSNGAMMAQRLICESDVFASIVPISGVLNDPVETCPHAKGKKILSIHGQDDENVPLEGGKGTKGISDVTYQSEAHTKAVYDKSGATYILEVVPNADHMLNHIDEVIQKTEGMSIAEKITKFFGLAN
jgi:polyhydroxybutyrate depolymerase